MKHVFVRPAEPKDVDNVLAWSRNNPEWDPEVGRYKNTYTLCAFDESGPIMYMPVQQPQMLDAAAINPNASALQIANAFREITQAVVTEAFLKGAGEVYFLDTDPGTSKFAGNQLFVELPWKAYRIKLNDLIKEAQCSTPE
jgi:hypothetical protein